MAPLPRTRSPRRGRGVGGHDHHRKQFVRATGRTQELHHLEAVHARHLEVEQDHVGLETLDRIEHERRIGDEFDIGVSAPSQDRGHECEVRVVVVDDEDPSDERLGRSRGTASRTGCGGGGGGGVGGDGGGGGGGGGGVLGTIGSHTFSSFGRDVA